MPSFHRPQSLWFACALAWLIGVPTAWASDGEPGEAAQEESAVEAPALDSDASSTNKPSAEEPSAAQSTEPALISHSALSTRAAEAPWRGTRVGMRLIANPHSLDPAADLTYNPEVGFSADLRFRWWFLKQLYAQVDASVFKEFTRSDVTNTAGEPQWGDVGIKVGAPKVLVIPVAQISFSPALAFSLPTSKASQAKTMRLRVQAELAISRSFDVLKGMTLSYRATGAHSFYAYTTAGLDTPRIRECVGGFAVCGAYVNTGVRNVQWRVSQGLSFSTQFLKWLGAYLQAAWVADRVFESTDEATSTASFAPQDPTLWRHYLVFGLGVSFSPVPWMSLGLGASTQSPLLTPDSTIRSPFFNRYTTCFVELGLDLAHIVEGLSPEHSSHAGASSP